MTSRKIEIIYRKKEALKGYAQNVIKHPEKQVEQIANSIKTFGWTNPVLIDENDEIIAGHGRLLAADKLGIEQIPCVLLEGLTEAEKRAYRIADNKIPLNGSWDLDMLQLELSELQALDIDISVTGFSDTELEDLLSDGVNEIENDDDRYTSKVQTPIYEPSDVQPEVFELYDEEKTEALKQSIKAAQLPEDIEKFLMSAAERHTIFNFSKIADYYAHAPADIQALFEQSALVIIDYNKAIEQGLVHMTKSIVDAVFDGEEGDDA
ncbi:ParB/Srx family N-terminal domain-containing protein [Hafnia alvei]|uniref:ParB/Srx family N-terminal domain-containing protein n=1 Tax=Hafnia alvei TaxID=569 RepID=UPI001412BF58|nr:ParB N-terminal domain-containing protein [Hafnia alvei]QIP56843.1 ParB N-terminal domain-containing protein [Hafnia alvei]